MFALRCTQVLLKRLAPHPAPSGATTTVLGDWYANRFNMERHRLIMATSERSLLTILTPAKDLPGLPERLARALGDVLPALGIGAAAVAHELAEMRDVRIDRTESRSVLASMNQFAFDAGAGFYRPGEAVVYLDEVALRLSETPCKRFGYASPAERVRELFGTPNRRPGRIPALRRA